MGVHYSSGNSNYLREHLIQFLFVFLTTQNKEHNI